MCRKAPRRNGTAGLLAIRAGVWPGSISHALVSATCLHGDSAPFGKLRSSSSPIGALGWPLGSDVGTA